MITRFDHAVIAVRDLDDAMARFRAAGFDVAPGGRHAGRGTANAIIRFGLDYMELLAVVNEAEALASPLGGPALVRFIAERGGGLVGFALAADDVTGRGMGLDAVIGAHLGADGPFPMQRHRPDGTVLSWRILLPGGVAWRRPWPFLIQWETPDAQRLAWERPGTHANGAKGVAGIAVAAANLATTVSIYEDQFGLKAERIEEVPELAARRAIFRLGDFAITVVAPDVAAAETGDSAGAAEERLQDRGQGPIELGLAVADLDRTRAALEAGGAHPEPVLGDAGALLVTEDQILGVRLIFRLRGNERHN